MKTTQKILAGFIGASVTATLAGTLIYKASVHEQICRSYENQLDASLAKSADMLTEMVGILYDLQQNPLTAFASMGRVLPLSQGAREVTSQINNTFYAYVGTCGQNRKVQWGSQPKVMSLFEQIQVQNTEIQKMSLQ